MSLFKDTVRVSHPGKQSSDPIENTGYVVWLAFHSAATETFDHASHVHTSDDGNLNFGVTLETTSRRIWDRVYPEGSPDTHITIIPVMQKLKRSGNVVCIRKAHSAKDLSTWFVRDSFREFSAIGPKVRKPTVKVSAKEAGEDREPGEVTVRRVKAKPKKMTYFMAVGPNLFKCLKCAYTDTSRTSVMVHVNKLQDKEHGPETLPCFYKCGHVADNFRSRASHLLRVHREQLKNDGWRVCHQCEYFGTNTKDIRSHAATAHKVPRKKATGERTLRIKPTNVKPAPVSVGDVITADDDFALQLAEMLSNKIRQTNNGRVESLEKALQQANEESERLRNQIKAMRDQAKLLFGE